MFVGIFLVGIFDFHGRVDLGSFWKTILRVFLAV